LSGVLVVGSKYGRKGGSIKKDQKHASGIILLETTKGSIIPVDKKSHGRLMTEEEESQRRRDISLGGIYKLTGSRTKKMGVGPHLQHGVRGD